MLFWNPLRFGMLFAFGFGILDGSGLMRKASGSRFMLFGLNPWLGLRDLGKIKGLYWEPQIGNPKNIVGI